MNTGRNSLPGRALRAARDAFASVLFPAPCYVCRQPLETASRVPICAACLNSLRRISAPICRQCGRSLPAIFHAEASPICPACAQGLYRFDLARSFAEYDSTMQRVMTLLKYSPAAPLGSWLARQVEPIIGAEPFLRKVNWVVPVPLDSTRLRQRGYNQAELIARPLANRLELPLATDLLRRLRPRPARQKLTRRERWETVRGAFEAGPAGRVDRSHILLVDDVMTSGATLDACAKALRSRGAEAVYAVTVARVLPSGEAAPSGITR